MYFLGIETSCDETAAAVFTEEPTILSNVVASQTDLHARFGGVVPEVAARAHLQRLLPVIDESLKQAGVRLDQIGCIAVHNTPGLVGALLVGVSAAKMLALALQVPLVSANHIESHIYACRLANVPLALPSPAAAGAEGIEDRAPRLPASPASVLPSPPASGGEGMGVRGAAGREIFPCVGLVVSGGHTCLFHCKSALEFDLLGATLDDAAGEAFDKVASILDLGFPGGPAVEREAAGGNPDAYRFPRSFLKDDRLDFSFSGLKTAVLYTVCGQDLSHAATTLTNEERANLAASFQQAVVDVLVEKSRQALHRTGLKRLAVGGGVAANRCLRAALERMASEEGAELFIPPMKLCTDNAAMAAIAVEKWRRQQWAPADLDAVPAAYGGEKKQ